jgi:EAL domain-containing protein (putative c-di-GMP-specific phosphodiesterase class I)
MRVAFRELTFSLDVLETRLPATMRPEQDTALLLHLGRYLDQRMLQVLRLDRGSATPLDIGVNADIALHLNLSLPGVLSNAFAVFAEDCRAAGRSLGIEISLVEAVADPPAFARAAARLRRLGARLVLDGVSHLALALSRPALLGADLIKLAWSSRITELPPDDQEALGTGLRDAEPARIVLQRAETEAAVRWGLANGIRLFQGRYVDQMQAVRRMVACPKAAACTLRQCVERAIATGGAGRASCANLPLLDAALPPPGTAPATPLAAKP